MQALVLHRRICGSGSKQKSALPGSLLGESKFFISIEFQVRLGYRFQPNPYLTARAVFKHHFLTIDADQATAEISLAINWPARSQFRESAGEPFVVLLLVKTSFKTGRRHFQYVGRMNEIFDVQNRANVQAYLRTVLVSDPRRFINKNANDGLVVRPCDFGVYQFQSVVDCNAFSDCLYAIFD
jgi:hypothetical protein